MTRKQRSQRRRRSKPRRSAFGRARPMGAFAVMLLGAAFALLAPELSKKWRAPVLVAASAAAPVGDPAQAAVATATGDEATRADASAAENAPAANPFIGEWRGSGWVARSNGEREQLRCRASHRAREESERTIHVLRCASERFQIDLTSGLTRRGSKISGWWREASHNRQGGLSGTHNGDRLNLYLRGENMTASLQATIKGCEQSIGIRITQEGDRKGFVSLKKVDC